MAAIHPVVDEGLGNSAYVVELGDRRALVIDPARDPSPYLELARWRRLQIAYVAETHLHADFLTGWASPIAAWRTARRSTWAGSPCGCWPPLGTPPSTPATCSWTALGL
jgi:ribonuclease BN (tRNA processing enzyme)